MGFENYGNRRGNRSNDCECSTCATAANENGYCDKDCDNGYTQYNGRSNSSYREWKNQEKGCDNGCGNATTYTDNGCGCENGSAYTGNGCDNGTTYTNKQNDCECNVYAASSNGRAVRTTHNSECIDGETHIYFDSCEGTKELTLSSECHNEDSLGRVLDVNMTLCNMCPGRRCAVGVHLTEVDGNGTEYARGFRAFTVPAHNGSQNRDVALPSVRFIMPEDVSLVNSNASRHFVVRTTNHYMDEPQCGWGNWGSSKH